MIILGKNAEDFRTDLMAGEIKQIPENPPNFSYCLYVSNTTDAPLFVKLNREGSGGIHVRPYETREFCLSANDKVDRKSVV